MAFFKDLSTSNYFDRDSEYSYGFKNLLSVGWIDKDENGDINYTKGDVSDDFLNKLKDLINNRYKYVGYMGCHVSVFNERICEQGQVFIPYKHKIYCCPKLIAHYIEDAQYKPPDEFIDAVMSIEGPLSGDKYENNIKSIDYNVWYFLMMNKACVEVESAEVKDLMRENAPWRKAHDELSSKREEENRKEEKARQKYMKKRYKEIKKMREENPEEFLDMVRGIYK